MNSLISIIASSMLTSLLTIPRLEKVSSDRLGAHIDILGAFESRFRVQLKYVVQRSILGFYYFAAWVFSVPYVYPVPRRDTLQFYVTD